MNNFSNEQWRGHFAMLLFAVFVAGSFSLGSLVANEITPKAITTARFIGAALVMGIFARLQGPVNGQSMGVMWRYPLMGGLIATYFLLMFEGLKTADPISASAVFTLVPVMSAGFGYLLLRQLMTRRMALALAVGAGGALWVIFRGELGALSSLAVGRGELIFFIGCIFHAFYAPLVRKLNRGETAIMFAFGTLAGGAFFLLLISFRDMLATDWLALPVIVWVTIGYLVIFSTASSFVLLQYATLRLPSAKVMAYTYLTPSFVILWEIAFGNSWPPLTVMLGVLVTVFALLILLKDEATS